MSDMARATVSIRELQQNLKQVLARVELGQTIDVTRRRRPVAQLTPIRHSARRAAWPDLEARAKAVFGNRVVRTSASQAVLDARGER